MGFPWFRRIETAVLKNNFAEIFIILMKLQKYILTLLFFPVIATAKDKTEDISSDWLFILKDEVNAKYAEYDDSGWRMLSLPHDWAFENGFSPEGMQKDKGGYTSGGIGWYRKYLDISETMLERKLFLDFDAVYMNSEVWINGHYLGKRPYGYISFSYEITRYVHPGKNTIAVKVDNSLEPSARWYHGCGIYGKVHLRSEQDMHFVKDGIFIRTPEISDEKGTVLVSYELSKNNPNAIVRARILKSGEKLAEASVESGKTVQLSVNNPELWSPESPQLYTLVIDIKDRKGKIQDCEKINFGFRTMGWDPEKGFSLNDKNLKLRGVCEHLEGGPVGAMWTEELLEWKLNLLKEMGCNAIRTAHNPQLPYFYDLCDKLGILVMDEIFDGWRRKADYDYGAQAFNEWWEKDLRAFIRRDRNHPCVFIYSVGNETKGDIAEELVNVCHEEDPDRMVTSGHSGSEYMDVFGMNGNSEKQSFLLSYKPGNKAFIGTETPHTWQVRGFYRTKTWYRDGYPNKWQDPFEIPDLTEEEIFGYDWTAPQNRRNVKQVFNSSYDNATVRLTARHNLAFLRDLPWYSGHFRWTGFDYLGEAGYVHGGWPFRAFMGGVVDLAGFKKDHYYLYQSQWREKDLDMVHILPHWTHPDMTSGTVIPVWVYTTGDSAELFLNGKSLGVRHKGNEWNKMQCEWKVPYSPGKITAVAYRNGKEVCRSSVQTSRYGADFKMAKDQTAGDISILSFKTTDMHGNFYPYGDNRLFVRLPENAEMLSFENGNPIDTECNFRASSRRAFFGLCRAFIRSSTGKGAVIAGCINGDRSLKMSDTISIDIKTLDLKTGKTRPVKYEIRYTTDGSEPDMNSTTYTAPFKIRKGMTVKAAAFRRDSIILRMEESFGDNTCLYWGKPGEEVCKNEGLQAEYAVLHKATVNNNGENVNGGGYVSLKKPGSSITWYQENDGAPMTATVKIRYSQKSESNTPTTTMLLQNNDETICILEFQDTGSKDMDWQYIEAEIPLTNGANYIRLSATSSESPNIDEIIIQ